jgi:hypothetical protein
VADLDRQLSAICFRPRASLASEISLRVHRGAAPEAPPANWEFAAVALLALLLGLTLFLFWRIALRLPS